MMWLKLVDPCRCRIPPPTCKAPAPPCFRNPEPKNVNRLILIRLRLARRGLKPLRAVRRRPWRRLARLEATQRRAKDTGKFPVKAREIPCSEGISPEAAPAGSMSRRPVEPAPPAHARSPLLSGAGI